MLCARSQSKRGLVCSTGAGRRPTIIGAGQARFEQHQHHGFQTLVIVALQVSILSTVFGFGLKTRSEDMLYLVRRPGLLVRSLIAVFLIVPVVAIVLDMMFDFRPTLEVVLVALSLSPVPPLLPAKESKAGGQRSYALGLMALLALLSIVIVPLAMALIGSSSVDRSGWRPAPSRASP